MRRSRRGVLARMLAGVLPAPALLATASAALADWQEDLAAQLGWVTNAWFSSIAA